MKVSFYRYMLAAVAAASLTAAGSALAQVDVAKSSVTATSKQMNVPVEGKFGKFTAQVKFDPAKPADGSAQADSAWPDSGSATTASPGTGSASAGSAT